MDWDKTRIFYSVAQAGSFTKAGDGMNLSQSAVSRQISTLEESLGVPLFRRHARGLLLTEQGEILYRAVQEVFTRLATAENAISDSKERPKGPLKITTTVAFGSTWLTPRLKEFMELFPDISVTLIVEDRALDLGMREADVAIRMYMPKEPDLIQRPLMTIENGVYASTDYLSRYGIPHRVDDLDKHRLIVYSEESRAPYENINWLLKEGTNSRSERRAALRINSLPAMLRAVKSGVGIASLPSYMVLGSRRLTRILQDLEGPKVESYFVYPEELRNSKRVKVFRDFIVRKVSESKFS